MYTVHVLYGPDENLEKLWLHTQTQVLAIYLHLVPQHADTPHHMILSEDALTHPALQEGALQEVSSTTTSNITPKPPTKLFFPVINLSVFVCFV